MGQWLPERARPVFVRDLVQYRRRFRIMVPLTVCAALALLGVHEGTLPAEQAMLTALIEALPPEMAEGMLVTLLQSLIDPNAASE